LSVDGEFRTGRCVVALRFQDGRDEVDRAAKESRATGVTVFLLLVLAVITGAIYWFGGESLASYEKELVFYIGLAFFIWLAAPFYHEFRIRTKEIDGKVSAIDGALSSSREAHEELLKRLTAIEEAVNVRTAMTISLSVNERLILRNQYEILSHLAPNEENKEFCEKAIEILESGYEFHYSELIPWPMQSLNNEKSNFIHNVLSMFDDVARAVEKNLFFAEFPDKLLNDAKFRGFDWRCDTEYIRYAQFLVHKKGIFHRFKDLDFASHNPISLEKYRRMLDIWYSLSIEERSELSPSNLARVLAA
jgi:uncharacterized protein YfbU (UPF0304 family)